jgi:hypothetical protein
MIVAGVDVWKGQWVLVVLDGGRCRRALLNASLFEHDGTFAAAEREHGSVISVAAPRSAMTRFTGGWV